MELALLDAWHDKRITLPVVTVDFAGQNLEKDLRVTSLEAPHRIADALLRDSLDPMDGNKPFRKSKNGARLDHVDLRNATVLFELSPTSLVFGLWDSTGPKGGLGAKFQRAIVSEIIGLNAQFTVATSSRIDPLQISKHAGPIYESEDKEEHIEWTLNSDLAVRVSRPKQIIATIRQRSSMAVGFALKRLGKRPSCRWPPCGGCGFH
jgi:CRISPR-associated protein Csb1